MSTRTASRSPSRPAARDLVRPHDLVRELETSFLDYSMSVITSRALPDARDGLKPVQRRILVTCLDEGLHPNRPYKKSATVVGTALGRYHPHGDSSVYEALVRMAQPFAMAEPLIDGQGNFGSIDGDPAAAYRYTEARLTAAAAELLADLDRETVEFRPNFDGRYQEPEVLPAKLPNLLLNGSEGIAVGMATRIPPHNLRELAQAIALLCDQPGVDDEALIAKLKGPDFPTGGILVQSPEIKGLYRTGRARLLVRAKAHVEATRTGRSAIIVTEIPYGVTKAKLLETIAELVRESGRSAQEQKAKASRGLVTRPKGRKPVAAPVWHEWIGDLRDESDREGMRIVVELKRDVDPVPVLRALFEKTDLQNTYPAQLLALVNGAPETLTLRRALEVFVAHRLDVVVRRARHELAKAEARAHIVDGLLVAIANIDEVVKTIKQAPDTATASARLQKRFKLSERQAEAILQMRLARLTALDVTTLKEEQTTLKQTIKELTAFIASPPAQRRRVREETVAIAEQFGRPRRTQVLAGKQAEDVAPETVEHVAQLTITRSGKVATAAEGEKTRARTNDPVLHRFRLTTAEQAVVFTSGGRAFPLTTHDIPLGQSPVPLAGVLSAAEKAERVLWATIPSHLRSDDLLFVLSTGLVKRLPRQDVQALRATGLVVTTLQAEDTLLAVLPVTAADEVLLVSAQGKAIRIPVADFPVQGRAARGVQGMKLAAGDRLVSASVARGPVLVATTGAFGKLVALEHFPVQGRAGQGVMIARLTPDTGAIIAGVSLALDTDLLVQSAEGMVLRLGATDLVPMDRPALGKPITDAAGWRLADGQLVPTLAALKR